MSENLTPTKYPPKPLLGYGAGLMGDEEIALVTKVLKDKLPFRYYGPTAECCPDMTSGLEEDMKTVLGVDYALAVTSGTAALEVALGALGVGPGDEVILAGWSFISCFTSVVRVGAKPVLAEINDTFCIDPAEIDRLTTPRTKAVIVVHYQGVAAEMDEILAAAKRHNIAVLEDCAESFGASYKGRPVGSMGDIASFSFQYNKVLSSGEGGAVVTSNPRLYERAVRMHDLGQMRPYHETVKAPTEKAFCGGQYRMSEITAAVARAQLKKLPEVIRHCAALSARIRPAIAALPGVKVRRLPDAAGEVAIESYFWLKDADTVARLKAFLEERNVHCQKVTATYCHYRREYCLERGTHYGQNPDFAGEGVWPAKGYRPEDFPVTEQLITNYMALPVGCYFTEADADHIVACLHEAAGLMKNGKL